MTERITGPGFRVLGIVAIALVLIGVGLRVVQWVGNPSFWLDEAHLADNVVHSGLWELLGKPLRWAQVAPVGFLFLERVADQLFGSGERSLRLVPFLGSLVALVVFWVLARRLLRAPGAAVATGVMALNPLLISLSGTLKQYSTDVAATTLILLVAVTFLSEDRWDSRAVGSNESSLRWFWGTAAAGLLSFVSIPSVIVAGPAILALVLRDLPHGFFDRLWWRVRGVPLALWGGGMAVAALREKWILDRRWGSFMTQWWGERGSFLPPFLEEPLALLTQLRSGLFRGLLFQPYVRGTAVHGLLVDTRLTSYGLALLCLLGALGFIWMMRGRWLEWFLLILGPIAFSIVLARLEVYPLDTRTSVFLLPLVALILGRGVDLITGIRWLGGSAGVVLVVSLALSPFLKVVLDRPPVYHITPTRELIADLAERRDPSEPVYGFWNSGSIFGYYGRRFGVFENVRAVPKTDLRNNLKDLVEYRGQRAIWVVFPNHHGQETDVLLCFLGAIGRETDAVYRSAPRREGSLSIHRFEFVDQAGWDRVDPELFPVDPEDLANGWPGCVPDAPVSGGS